MEIDRARFLALVSAIGASTVCACAAGPKETAPIQLPPPPPKASASARPAPASPPPPVASAAPASSLGLWGYAPIDPPKTCAAVKCPIGAPYDEMRPVVAHDCKALEWGLRPEPFQRVMACLLQPNAAGPCDAPLFGVEPGMCLERWSEPPEIDPSTEAKCKPIVARCSGPDRSSYAGSGTLTMAQCQGILSVTRPRAQSRMIHCVIEYCDDAPKLCYMDFQR